MSGSILTRKRLLLDHWAMHEETRIHMFGSDTNETTLLLADGEWEEMGRPGILTLTVEVGDAIEED